MKNLLIIGAGSIGRRHLGNFYKHGVKTISCVDPNSDRLRQAQEVCPIKKGYASHQEALADDKFEGVVIASPTSMHVEAAIDVAKTGAHIFIEKPVSHNLEQLEKLINITRDNNVKTFVAYCHRFIPSVVRLKEILDNKLLGNAYAFNMNWGSYLPNWHPWEDYRHFYMAKKSQGGGALLDESHGIDLLRHLFGEATSVMGDVGQISHLEIDSDDWAAMLLQMESGVRGKVHFDLMRHDPQIKLEILCEKGSITWDRVDHKITLYHAEDKKYEIIPYTLADVLSMYDSETKHFINCVDGNEDSLIDLEDGVKTMQIIDAAFKSSENGNRVVLESNTVHLVSEYA